MSSDYPLVIHVYNGIQYFSVVSGCLAGMISSVCLFVGLHNNKGAISTYKDGFLLFTAVHFVSCVVALVLFPVASYPSGSVYLLAHYYPAWLSFILTTIFDICMIVGCTMLAMLMLYRVIFFVRPKSLRVAQPFLVIFSFSPALLIFVTIEDEMLIYQDACDLLCLDENATFPLKRFMVKSYGSKLYVYVLYYLVFFIVIIVGIPGIVILNRWFKTKTLSQQTRKLQRRLSRGWIWMILIHTILFLPTVVMVIRKVLPNTTILEVDVGAILMIISMSASFWVIPLKILVFFIVLRRGLQAPDWLKSLNRKLKFSKTERSTVSVITS